MDWKPIETAPKDGSSILLLSKEYEDEWPEYKEDGSFEMKPVNHPPKVAIGRWNAEGTSRPDGILGVVTTARDLEIIRPT